MNQPDSSRAILVNSNTSSSALSVATESTMTNGTESESMSSMLLKEEATASSYYVDCICKVKVDDGFTIQCEECLCWNHAKCIGIDKTNIPSKYICPKCKTTTTSSSFVGRKSKKPQYIHIEDNIFEADTFGTIKLLIGAYEKILMKMPQLWDDEKSYKKCNFKLCREIVAFPSTDSMKDAFKLVDSRDPRRKGPPVLGRGLYIGEDADPGTIICEYLGHWKSLFLSEGQEQGIDEDVVDFNKEIFALGLQPSTGLYIDTRRFGNVSRFIRRSCRPNCEIKFALTGDDLKDIHVCIFANKFIQAGDELLISIDFPDKELAYNAECACASPDFCLGPYPCVPTSMLSSSSISSRHHHHGHNHHNSTEKASTVATVSTTHQPSLASISSSSSTTIKQGETKKLSREERKLQQYIEFFEKMENAEKTKHHRKSTTTTQFSSLANPPSPTDIIKSSLSSRSRTSPKAASSDNIIKTEQETSSSSPLKTRRKSNVNKQGRKKKTLSRKFSMMEEQQRTPMAADLSMDLDEESPKTNTSTPITSPSSTMNNNNRNNNGDDEDIRIREEEEEEDSNSENLFPIEVVDDNNRATPTPSMGDLSLNTNTTTTNTNSQMETPTKKRVSLSDYLRKKKEEREILSRAEDQEDGELHEDPFGERRFSTPQPERSYRSPDYDWKRSISYVNSPQESHNYHHRDRRNYYQSNNDHFYYHGNVAKPSLPSLSSSDHYSKREDYYLHYPNNVNNIPNLSSSSRHYNNINDNINISNNINHRSSSTYYQNNDKHYYHENSNNDYSNSSRRKHNNNNNNYYDDDGNNSINKGGEEYDHRAPPPLNKYYSNNSNNNFNKKYSER